MLLEYQIDWVKIDDFMVIANFLAVYFFVTHTLDFEQKFSGSNFEAVDAFIQRKKPISKGGKQFQYALMTHMNLCYVQSILYEK